MMSTNRTDLPVEVHAVPWSYRGSYLSLCSLNSTDVHLSTHQIPIGKPLFSLRPSPIALPSPSGFPDTPSPTFFSATPSTLTWSLEDKPVVRAVFQDARTIRLKGTIPLNLDTDARVLGGGYNSYISPILGRDLPELLEFTTFGYKGMYLVAIKGSFTCINDLTANDGNRRITISGEAGWELAMVERDTEHSDHFRPYSAILPPLSTPFDAVQEQSQTEFDHYRKALCPWTSSPSMTETYAAYALWASTVRPMGLLKREGVLMSKNWMDKIWSWDNCFNAIALAPLSLEHAIDNLLVPFDHQTPEGRLPDSLTQCEILYDFVKPPICGWALFKIQEVRKIGARTLEDLYKKVSRQTHFWLINRSNTHSSLPHYVHGNDSGWDNATCFDGDPVIVSPDLAALLVIQTDWLAVTAATLKLGEECSRWVFTRDRLTQDMVDELWKDDQFCVKEARTGKLRPTTSLLPLVSLVAASYLPKPVVSAMVRRLHHHLTDYGLATEATDSGLYEADGYWRGPIWAPPTLLIESGLREAGQTDMADRIRDRFLKLCGKSGFSENYDALEGKGNRDPMYTWAAAVYLVFAREKTLV